MRKFIHYIRRQHEEVRKHILYVLVVLIAIMLFFLWVFSLGTNLTNQNTQIKMNNDLKPFSSLKDNIVGGYKSIFGPQVDAQ